MKNIFKQKGKIKSLFVKQSISFEGKNIQRLNMIKGENGFLVKIKINEVMFESVPQLFLQFYFLDQRIEHFEIEFPNSNKQQIFSILMGLISLSYFYSNMIFNEGSLFSYISIIKLIRFFSNFLFLISRLFPFIVLIRKSLFSLSLLFFYLILHSIYIYRNDNLVMNLCMSIYFSMVHALFETFAFYEFWNYSKKKNMVFHLILLIENILIFSILYYYSSDYSFLFFILSISLICYLLSLLIESLNYNLYKIIIKLEFV